ncbi:MAG: zinc-ribbon domain-containing protein [Vagococcus sp.]|uniref:zinc-ribbon domain-containing protein n=1 Tax=Vagococcus sp. TaxID=1933889 RepID=UPI002FC65759
MTKFCTNCGTQLPSESKFCAKCGAKIKLDGEQVAQQEIPSQTTTKKNQVNQVTQVVKKRWPILVGIACVLLIGFWLVNRNPLKGEWTSTEEGIDISIKGNNAEMTFPDFSSKTKVSFNGPIKKVGNNEYLFPIKDSNLVVTFLDAAEQEDNINDTLKEIEEELLSSDLSSSEKKVIKKALKTVKRSGDNMILSMNMKDYGALLSVDADDFLEIADFMTFNFYMKSKGSTQIVVGDSKNREESIVLDKK